MKKYQEFKSITEARRPKKCPVLNFKPIRESEVYKDMISMGFNEVLADNPQGIEVVGTEEQRYFKDRLGNIAFFHPAFAFKQNFPYYNIMHNGSIRVWTGSSKSSEYPGLSTDLRKACMTVEDYLFKMGFLIKLLCQKQGFPVTDRELMDNESYKDMIDRKMQQNPSVAGKLPAIPASLKDTDLGSATDMLKGWGAFDRD
jgi:hypothetical protein